MKKAKRADSTLPASRQSVLRTMAGLLCVSVLFRAGELFGMATAQTIVPAKPAIERPDQVLGMPLDDQSLPQILEMFKNREARLIIKENEVAAREVALSESAAQVTALLDQLAGAEAKLAATLSMTNSAAAEDLARLATVYENMKPQDTAALFAEMAPGFAAGFLGLMRPEAAAAIMTELEPKTAHLISVMLAGRNATAPRRQE